MPFPSWPGTRLPTLPTSALPGFPQPRPGKPEGMIPTMGLTHCAAFPVNSPLAWVSKKCA